MFPTKTAWDKQRIKKIFDLRNFTLYVFLLIVFAIAWSGVKSIQNNYELQKKISTLKQQNAVLGLQNENTALQNQYYQTNQYLDLAARQDLGLAAPGEQVMLVPKSVAMKYVDQSISPAKNQSPAKRSKLILNLESWRDFLLGRNIVSE